MAKQSQNVALFTTELKKLMDKHGCYLVGNIKVKITSDDRLDLTTYLCEVAEAIDCGMGIFDRMGPFLIGHANQKISHSNFDAKKSNITVLMADKLLENGVLSPINQEAFHNRREWKEHLKANNCVEFGNDLNNAKPRSDVRGDFNCREELGKATYEIMEKYGH